MRAIRSAIFVVWTYGLMAVLAVMLAPSLLMPRAISRACLQFYLGLVFWGLRVFCGVTFRFEGLAKLPEGGALIASQHQSMFETLAYWTVLKDPAIVLKRSLAYLPFFGWYAVKPRNLVVNRSDGAKALRKMLADARNRAAEGRQIVIFPQGTRVAPGSEIVLQPGVAGLYKAMEVPCVPVALNSGEHWPDKGFMRTPGEISIRFLDPIEPGLAKADFMLALTTAISEGDAELRNLKAAAAAGDAAHSKLNRQGAKA